MESKLLLQPKQKQMYALLNDNETRVIGYGGAKGGAKSHVIRILAILYCMQHAGARVLLFRRTYMELNENHIQRIFLDFPWIRDWFNKVERLVTFPNGSTLRFGYAETDKDIEAYNGKEYDVVFIDQAEYCTVYQIAMLKAANRVSGRLAKFVMTFNPGGISHKWLKSKFVDKSFSETEKREKWEFIQSFVWDNVEWVKDQLKQDGYTVKEYYHHWTNDQRQKYCLDRSDYAKNLQNLPDPDMITAYLWGDWDVFSGQFFSMFRENIHVIPDDFPIDETWVRHGAIDYGSVTVMELGVRDNEDRVIIDHEVYTEDMPPSDRAEVMANVLLKNKIYNIPMYCDTNMFGDFKNYLGAMKSPAETFREVWKKMMGTGAPTIIPVSKRQEDARKYRVLCNEAFKEYLKWKKDANGVFTYRPHLFVKERVQDLRKNIITLIFDANNPMDFDPKIGSDHSFDAAKYLLMSFYKPLLNVKSELSFENDPTRYIFEKILIPQQKRLGITSKQLTLEDAQKSRRTFTYY